MADLYSPKTWKIREDLYTTWFIPWAPRRSIDDPIPTAAEGFARPHRKGREKCGKSPAWHSRFNSGQEVKVNYDGGAMSPPDFPTFLWKDPGW